MDELNFDHEHTAWQPVTIEMTFETCEQLDVWVDNLDNNTITHALKDISDRTDVESHATRHMSQNVILSTINDLVECETWGQLR